MLIKMRRLENLEVMNGVQRVGGSNPLTTTNKINGLRFVSVTPFVCPVILSRYTPAFWNPDTDSMSLS